MQRTTAPATERDAMTYVILIVVAVVIIGGLYLVRGRRSA
jgi:hypothetical protein